MGRKSSVEKSIHYNEILEKIKSKESGRKISDWLLNEHNEKISANAICNYKKKLDKEAVKKVESIVNVQAENIVSKENYKDELVNNLISFNELNKKVPIIIEQLLSRELTNSELMQLLRVISIYAKMSFEYYELIKKTKEEEEIWESHINEELTEEIERDYYERLKKKYGNEKCNLEDIAGKGLLEEIREDYFKDLEEEYRTKNNISI